MATTDERTKYTGGPGVSDVNVYASGQLQPDAGAQPVSKPELVNPDGTPTKKGWRKIAENFAEPFEHKSYTQPTKNGKTLSFDYITARQVADRLDKVIGPGNWSTRFSIIDSSAHVVECTLTIFGVEKSDAGYPNSPGSEYETEPFKAAYSDAFKRAAVQWGVGRYLYGD